MTFEAIVRADTLSSTLDSLTTILDECKVHLNEDGLEIRGCDPANAGMVDLSLDAAAFESYNADGGLIGVDLDRLTDVIDIADSDDLVNLRLDEETRKLHIEVDGLEYTLALIDPDAIRQEPDIPDLDLPGEYTLEGRALDRVVMAADLCSDHITISPRADAELVFEAEGDTDDVTVTLEGDELVDSELDGDPCRSLFSLAYLEDMTDPIGSDDEVTIRVGEEMPVKYRYSQCDGDLSVLCLIAPRITGDGS